MDILLFLGYFGNFGDVRSIFTILVTPKGYFGDLSAHYSRFMCTLVILEVFGLFWSFRDFKAILVN